MSAKRTADERALVPDADGSHLGLSELRLVAGAPHGLADAGHDTLLFCVEGDAVLDCTGARHELTPATAAIVHAGEAAEVTTSGAANVLLFSIGIAADTHAPLGPDARLAVVDRAEDDPATGKRAFQVLFGAENGCCHATLFVGYVPPGKAPWHFHLYDEIVWIWRGSARYHYGETTTELGSGTAVRIRPRDIHINENVSGTDELVLLGLFTPAGSPSAAYLAP